LTSKLNLISIEFVCFKKKEDTTGKIKTGDEEELKL